tara:strand:- start:299 stop:493 length:195 start_codon:yes stop_codon:yes gene_type:complete
MPTKITATKTTDQVEVVKVKRHHLYNATPQQIDTYIEANVTDLASAKDVLKILAKIIILNKGKQ